MNTHRIRFGTYARVLRANEWLSIIPVKPDKAPAISGWSDHGLTPPSDQLIETWRAEYPGCGIGYVMDGNVVAFDADVSIDRFRKLGFTIKDAERTARDLAADVKALAVKTLGPTDFVRVGLAPKFMLFYTAVDTIPTMAGSAVEVFCGPATKQVLLYGFHAEAVDEYRWVGPYQPLTHSIDMLPAVTAEQAVEFRVEALALCDQAGLRAQPRTSSGNSSGRVSSGIVGDYMSEILSLIGKNFRTDPRAIAAEYFRQSVDGEKHYRMVAVCGALILRRFSDDDIVSALAPVYRAIVHDDPSMSRLSVCPPRVRAGMRARGTKSPHWRNSTNGSVQTGRSAMARKRKPLPPTPVIGIDCEWRFDPETKSNKILSYQAHLIDPDTDLSYSYIHHVRPNRRGDHARLALGQFLVLVILGAFKAGVLASYPQSITLAGHFIRADLSMFSDCHSYLKRRLAPGRGTLVTTRRRLALNLPFPDGARRVTLAVVDSILLAPEKSPLEVIGPQVGAPKLEIMPGYSIEDMARYWEEQPEAFDAYGGRDAEIPARYVIAIFALLKSFGITSRVPTIGAAGVALFKGLFAKLEECLEFLGLDPNSSTEGRRQWKPDSRTALLMVTAAGCFHGGLNTIYRLGYSPPGREVLDVDLAGAYTTALSAIGWPDWSTSRYTKSLDDLAVIDEAMSFAQVRFRFPSGLKFPCLPVRSKKQHGLIYPLEGEAWCCGPELVVALAMGCVIEVMNGSRVEWIPGRANPLAVFARKIDVGRKGARAAGNALQEQLIKLCGNSLYGKISQGVGSKRPIADDVEDHRVFDTEIGEMVDLPPSSVTSPPIAAWATSLVRAMVSETLHRLPPTAIALQTTTDGILFAGEECDIDETGPVARVFRRARALVVGEPNPRIWEVKHRMPRVVTFKTRGMFPVVPADWSERIHIAKAGARFPDYLKTDVERANYAEQLYRGRDYNTKFERTELTSLSEQHRTGCDITSKRVNVRLNWDSDWKNQPVEPIADAEDVISFGTRPWRTVQEFEDRRDDFGEWGHNHHRVLKTSGDYFDFMEWTALRTTRKALRTNARGALPNLAQAIVAEVMRRPLRERPGYKEIAEIMARATGCVVTERQVKAIRSRRELISRQCVYQLSAADIEFARLYATNPIALNQLREAIVSGSIAERQFDEIWERRLPAPVPMIVNDRCDDAPQFVSATEPPVTLVAVAGGHSAAHQVGRPDQMAKSLKPVKSASLAERAALARTERVIEPAQAEQTTVAQDQPRTELTGLDQARIKRWIANQLIDWPPTSCLHCRKPLVVGQLWTVLSNGEVTARFHQDCHGAWLEQQEAFARRALGLAA